MDFFPVTSSFYSFLSIVTFVYVLLETIKNKIKIHLVTQCMILLEIIILISTAINSGSMRNAVDNAILIVYAAIFINYCAEKKRMFLLIKKHDATFRVMYIYKSGYSDNEARWIFYKNYICLWENAGMVFGL